MAVRGPIGHSGSNFCNRATNGAWHGGVDSGGLCAPGSDRTTSTMLERLSRARETQALGHGARGRAHAGAPHACRRDVRCRPSAKARSGGTRTPDTRIMVPLRFGTTAGFEGSGGHNRDMSATAVACPERPCPQPCQPGSDTSCAFTSSSTSGNSVPASPRPATLWWSRNVASCAMKCDPARLETSSLESGAR
jgi:hypothetical protein